MFNILHFLIVVSFTVILAKNVVNEKESYMTRLTKLYELSGLPGVSVPRDVVLPGMILDQLNSRLVTGDLHGYLHLVSADSKYFEPLTGEFSSVLTVQSLECGVVQYTVMGVADFQTFSVELKDVQKAADPVSSVSMLSDYLLYTPFNNGSNGIDELTKMERTTNCSRDGDRCKKGTVVVDRWLAETLQYQRLLSYNVPLNYVQFFGTHNSFNNKADGYGTGDFTLGKILEAISDDKWDFVWAQQWFTITDQLNMGVRYLMLDPVYFWGEMRLCHCGGGSVKWLNDAIKFIEKALHTKIDFDSHDLGCMPHDRLFSSAIQEIYEWMVAPDHGNEFVMVYINDETNDSDWGYIDLIQDPVANITKDLLFTPDIKQKLFPDRWPSIEELISVGKRLMVTCTSRCANGNIFLEMMIPSWDLDTVKYFRPFPNCTGYKPSDWYLVGGESQVVDPIYDGPHEEGLVIKENLPDLLACPLSVVQLDLASPELMSYGVWSWNVGYSIKNVTNTSCPAVDHNGRWLTVPCNKTLYHVCNKHNSTSFVTSTTPGSWTRPQCPSNSAFGLSHSGYENKLVLELMLEHHLSNIWINVTSTAINKR